LGQLPRASDCYRELVALEPADADLRNNFGILLARSGDPVSAIAQFEAALKLDPAHAAALRNLELARKKRPH
jgi:Tfp pilus assembly protein PilF